MSEQAPACRSCTALDHQLSRVEHLLARERQRREDAEARGEQYARDALTDPLTSLVTRPLLLDRLGVSLGRVRRTGIGVGVVAFNLDAFEDVNRQLGRNAADALLVELACRLRGLVRSGDTVARLSGDEFALVVEDVTEMDQLDRLAARVTSALVEPYTVEGGTISLRASFGVRLAEAGERPDVVIRDAEVAIYAAKSAGGGRVVAFNEAQNRQAEQMRFEADLRRAMRTQEIEPWYQPVFDLQTGDLTGVEALARWHHEEHGSVSPVDFIPAAEECGLVELITDRVLGAACEQAARWNGSSRRRPLLVHVNLSGLELSQPGLPMRVAKALNASGLDPAHLCLEITERSLVIENEFTQANLKALRKAGVRFAIDDFGVEYASFSYLRRFPVDIVKIDRSFLEGVGHDERDEAVLAGIVAMAKSLGMRTVAEGIETATQLDAIRRIGVDEAQGWHFGRPEPGARITARLRAEVAP